jgi:two-component system phosphate regulon sensor histidine kinase PhoR
VASGIGLWSESPPAQLFSVASTFRVSRVAFRAFTMLPAVITLLAIVALLALHFWWRGQLERERAAWQAETAKREAREHAVAADTHARQEALLDSMIEGVLVLDEDGRVQFANRAFAQIFRPAGSLVGKTVIEAVRQHEVAEFVARANQEGRVTANEIRLNTEPECWLQLNAAAITNAQKRQLGTVVVFHDQTQLKRLEGTREDFVANVSHELRTPLSLIKGYAETLLDGAKDNPEVATKFLQTIDRNARRLDLLIQDLLIISSLESGRVSLSLGAVDLKSLTERLLADFKTRADARHVKLVNAMPPLLAQADDARLEQVLGNLLENALKYGRENGTVTVGGRTAEEGLIELFVQDDGPGIPAEALERVFERFYRVDKARSREQGGTGLGLSIVKHIVQGHGGRVWVESQPGQGAKFFFTLPPAKPGEEV